MGTVLAGFQGGLRTVVPIYMVLSFEEGGPQLSHEQKGIIFAVWALVQSFVPIFTGGFADRYGYKLNIAISTVVKILGYLVMGWAIGLVVAGLVLRYGLGAESLAWVAIFAIAPVSGIYYPVSVLPDWLQYVAWLLPSSHVFEGMRAVMLLSPLPK